MEFLRETTIFKRIISSITKRIFQFFRIASLFLYLLYDIKISLKKMNSELWKILCFKISSERLLYDSFFFFFTKIYNNLQYRQFLSNIYCKFFKNKDKNDYVYGKKIIQKIHFDIYLEATQVLFQWNPHIFIFLINQYYLYR